MGVRLRVAVVGMGPVWESRHAPALRSLSDRFELCAFCDPIAHRAELAAAKWNARHTDSFRELCDDGQIDAVLLLSARWYGALPILAACDAGKAVYCAAALDLTEEEAGTVRKRVEQSGIAFMAEFPCRLAPATLRLKELIATHLGKPKLLFCNQRIASNDLSGSPQSSSMRHLIEMVDWCRYVVGDEPTSVFGTSHGSQEVPEPTGDSVVQCSSGQDYLVMALDFSTGNQTGTGPLAQIACGSYVPEEWSEATSFRRPADLQVVCQRGMAFIDLPNSLVWFDAAGQHSESLEHDRPVGEQLLMHFHRSVSSLVRKTSSLEDAYRALSIVNHAQRSYIDGHRIRC